MSLQSRAQPPGIQATMVEMTQYVDGTVVGDQGALSEGWLLKWF